VDPNLADIKSCPIAFENHGDDADMRQLAAVGVAKKKYALRKGEPTWMHFFLATPTFCGFRVSAPEIVWGKCATIIGLR
jgi:hypothetical protein